MNHEGPGWLYYAAMVGVLGGGVYLWLSVGQVWALEKLPDEERKAKWPKYRDRMLTAVGLWQYCVALVILTIPGGQWVNTIALFGMGTLMIFGVRFNRKISKRLGVDDV